MMARRTLQSMTDAELEDHKHRNAPCAGKSARELHVRILNEQIRREQAHA